MSTTTRITFSHIRDTIRHLGHNNRPVLGRWALNTDSHIERVVRHANEDHCGTCGFSENIPIVHKRSLNKNDVLEFDYSFMLLNTPN
jgi:hypothetical protein